MNIVTFSELGLAEPLMRALTARNHVTPTPIQARAIPELLKRRDVLGIAQTGTGKTAAFALPILHHLSRGQAPKGPRNPRALVLAPTRWKLRKVVKAVNEVLGSLRMEKHPDKTFIVRIERCFDFLGYHFGPEGLSVAKKTIERFVERAFRLYEPDRKEPSGPSRFGTYVRRWTGWAHAGLTDRPSLRSE